MRPFALKIAITVAYLVAWCNAVLSVVDLVMKLWLTLSVQFSLAVVCVVAAYLLSRTADLDAPPRVARVLAEWTVYTLGLVALLTLGVFFRSVTKESYDAFWKETTVSTEPDR